MATNPFLARTDLINSMSKHEGPAGWPFFIGGAPCGRSARAAQEGFRQEQRANVTRLAEIRLCQ